MPFTSVADFAAALRQGRLLDPEQLEQLAGMPSPQGDPRTLARELVRMGWLTPYQVNQLFLGRGDTLALGPYFLLDKLGEGGMGVVYKARHQKLGRIVALKIIRREHLTKAEAVRRFRREIRAAAQLDHPNLVRAYDADEIEGTHFIAMEYVDGVTLSRLVKERGPLSPADACECIRQGALGLQHAFERGLVHRDVKPSNLLLSQTHGLQPVSAGAIKLLDLGLARFAFDWDAAHSSTELTREGMAIGTADFMAPEQGEDARAVDIRADIYSLGCALYFLLTGRPPFPGGSLVDKMLRHRYDRPPALVTLRPGLPPRLIEVVDRLMAKEPAERYQTPADAALVLGQLMESGGLTAVGPESPPVERPVVDPRADTPDVFRDLDADTPPQSHPPPARRRSRRPFVAAGVCLAALGIGLAALVTRHDPAEDDATDDGPSAAPVKPPSPLPRLRQEDIPRERQFIGQPRELVGVFGETRRRHWGAVWCLASTRDGKLLASAGVDRGVRLWDGATGEEQALLPLQRGGIHRLAFSGDGKTLAAGGSDGSIHLWGLDRLGTPALSPLLDVLKEHSGPVNGLAFDPSRQLLASAGHDKRVLLWDLTAKRRPEILKVDAVLRGVAITPDGKLLAAAGEDGSVFLWDLATRQPRMTIAGKQPVAGVAFSPDGTLLAAGGADGAVRLWDVASLGGPTPPAPCCVLQGTGGGVLCLDFSDDAKTLAAGTAAYNVEIWDLTKVREAKTLAARTIRKGHRSEVHEVALTPDGSTVASAGDITVRLWDAATGKERAPLQGSQHALHAVAVAPDGATIAATGIEQVVRTWDVASGQERTPPLPQANYGHSLAFSPDGKLLASSAGNAVKIWDYAAGTLQSSFELRCTRPARLVFAADGHVLAAVGVDRNYVGRKNDALLWDVPARRELGHRLDSAVPVACADVSPDGRTLALGLTEAAVQLWDLAENRAGPRWNTGASPYSVAFSPDGKSLAIGGNGQLQLRDLASGQERLLHKEHRAASHGLAFSPDGRLLASADNEGRVIVWDRIAGRKIKDWQFPGLVHQVAFAADGRHLATANANGTAFVLRLW